VNVSGFKSYFFFFASSKFDSFDTSLLSPPSVMSSPSTDHFDNLFLIITTAGGYAAMVESMLLSLLDSDDC
jgi:hypothetical protein